MKTMCGGTLAVLAALLSTATAFTTPRSFLTYPVAQRVSSSDASSSMNGGALLSSSTTRLYLSPPSLPSVSLPIGASSDLTVYFLRSVIDAFVPTVASLVVLAFAAKVFNRKDKKSSMMSGDDGQLDYYQRFFDPSSDQGSKGSIRGLLSGLKRGSDDLQLGPQEQVRGWRVASCVECLCI